MKIFFDTEFTEGTQPRWKFWKTKPTIDLISIGMVNEVNHKYYAVSNEFNLKDAWNRYDIKTEEVFGDMRNIYPEGIKRKVYWIRENVLKPIWEELVKKELAVDQLAELEYPFTYKGLKYLIKKYGKSNKVIAKEIEKFAAGYDAYGNHYDYLAWCGVELEKKPKFYAYYADYDWVVFCWLFGKMNDLPSNFPQYCIDLKQELDLRVNSKRLYYHRDILGSPTTKDRLATFDEKLTMYNASNDYPKETNAHNSLADAQWNKELYEFIKNRLV